MQTLHVSSQAFPSGTRALPCCQGSSGHPDLCYTGWILTCSWPSPQLSAQVPGAVAGMRGMQMLTLPDSLLQALVKFLLMHSRQCAVIHAVSISCLFVKPKRNNLKLAETVTLLRLIWICSCKRILKVSLCCTETELCHFLVFLSAYFGIKATDITFNFILVHEHSC